MPDGGAWAACNLYLEGRWDLCGPAHFPVAAVTRVHAGVTPQDICGVSSGNEQPPAQWESAEAAFAGRGVGKRSRGKGMTWAPSRLLVWAGWRRSS